MDDLDRAAIVEQNQRDAALQHHQMREVPTCKNGRCHTCHEKIDPRRLKITATRRCIQCQRDHEQTQRHTAGA